MTHLLHPRAVVIGAGVALAVCVPAALLAQTLDKADRVDDNSSVLLVLFAVILAGMAGGGYAAAVRRPDAPLSNGAAAALSAYLLVQTVGAIRLLARGDDVTWVAIPFFGLLSAAAGVTGGLIAEQRARHR